MWVRYIKNDDQEMFNLGPPLGSHVISTQILRLQILSQITSDVNAST